MITFRKRAVKSVKKKIPILFLITLLLISVIAPQAVFAALPDNSGGGNTSDGYGEDWDGIDFEGMIGDGIYYGTYDHADKTWSYYSTTNLSSANKEGTETPVLWRVMGEEADDTYLTLFSEYVLDARPFNTLQDYPGSADYFNNRVQNVRTWLNNDTGFLASFGTTASAEYKGLASFGLKTKMFERNSGAEYVSSGSVFSSFPLDWREYFASYCWYSSNGYPITVSGQKAYIPWGLRGGSVNNVIAGWTSPAYPNNNTYSDAGYLYWDALNDRNESYLIGEPESGDYVGTLKNGIQVHYWTRSPNAESRVTNSASGMYFYPYLVISSNGGSIATQYFANETAGIRPIVKLIPENVIFAHEIVSGTPELYQVQADKGMTPDSWNYSTNDGSGTNYKLTILNSSLSLNELYKGSFSLTSGEDLHLDAGDSITLNSSDFNGEYLAYKIVYDDGTTRFVVSYGNNKAEADNETLVIKAANNIANTNNFIDSGDYTLYIWTQDETSDIRSFEGSNTWYFPLGVSGASDLISPEVISVNPEGTGIAVSTNKLSVTFNEEMNASAGFPGTVTLDNANISLTNGIWSNSNQTITYDLSGLNYSTTYIYEIKDFEDSAGNLMITPVPDFTFRTVDPGKTGGGNGSGSGTVIDDENTSIQMGGENSQMGGTDGDQMGGYEEDVQPILIILLFMIAVAVFAYRRCEEEKDAQDEMFMGWFRPF